MPKRFLCEEFDSIIKNTISSTKQIMTQEDIIQEMIKNSCSEALRPLAVQLEALQIGNVRNNDRRPKFHNGLPFPPPPIFSGGFGESFANWLKKFKKYLVLQGVSLTENDFCLAFFESNLGGQPSAIFYELSRRRNPPQNLDEYIEIFEQKFPEGRDADFYREFIYDRK